MDKPLPAIPNKRYFTIGETSVLCGVKAYVLRYWEQEFTQLKPMKRRGNRRYYQHHEVLLVRRIRELLYDQGFTISGARNRLSEEVAAGRRGAAVAGADGGLAAAARTAPEAQGAPAGPAGSDGEAPGATAPSVSAGAAHDGTSGSPRISAIGTAPPSADAPIAPGAVALRTLLAAGAPAPRDPLLVRAAAWASQAPSFAHPPLSTVVPTPRADATPLGWRELMAELLSIREILSP